MRPHALRFGVACLPLLIVLLCPQGTWATTISVTTTADLVANDGQCSLREAIKAANTNAASGTLPEECPAGSAAEGDRITLAAGSHTVSNGPITISSDVTLQGAGPTETIISGDQSDRLFFVQPVATQTVTFSGLTMTQGFSGGHGGAFIALDGSLIVTNCRFVKNRTMGDGGAIHIGHNVVAATISQSTFEENVTEDVFKTGADGGAISAQCPFQLTIEYCILTNNIAGTRGGAIFLECTSEQDPTVFLLKESTVTNNTSLNYNAIHLNRIQSTIEKSTIASNIKSNGISVDEGSLTLVDSTVTKHNGSGINMHNSGNTTTLNIRRSAITDNEGGIVLSNSTVATIENTTIVANNRSTNPGLNQGVRLINAIGPITLTHVTIAGHEHAGVSNEQQSAIAMGNSLLAGNATNCLNAAFTSNGGNLFTDATCTDADPTQGDLVASGEAEIFHGTALTETGAAGGQHMSLAGASLAINAGNVSVCVDQLAVDQLGTARVGGCDIGAVEAHCGDQILHTAIGEQCDAGTANADTAACTAACHTASCGDGLVQAGVEACDDQNQVNEDGCPNSCQSPQCGDQIVQAILGESCDDGDTVNTDNCLNSCAAAKCGDGIVQVGVDACDDGNAVNTDSCLNSCAVATCGDGVVQSGVETCDDGNAVETDECTTSCTVPTVVSPPPPQEDPVKPTKEPAPPLPTEDEQQPTTAAASGGCALIP